MVDGGVDGMQHGHGGLLAGPIALAAAQQPLRGRHVSGDKQLTWLQLWLPAHQTKQEGKEKNKQFRGRVC